MLQKRSYVRRLNPDGTRSRFSRTYPFSSLLECGFCGKPLSRRAWRSGKNYEKTIWQCMAVAHVIKLGLLAHKEPPLLFFARIEVLNHYTHSFLSVSQVSASSLSSSLQPAHWYCSSFRQRNEGSPKRRRIACRSSLLIRKRSA